MSKYQSSNIDEISLADALEFVVDNRGKTVPTDDNGIALIATNCISNEHIYPQKLNIRYVSQDVFDNWFRAHPKPGDIILTNKGSNNGEVCLVPNTVDFCIAQDMVAVRADKKKIDPLYLFAALRSRLVQKRIKYLNVDAVIPHFKKTDFNKLLIPLPDRKSQEFIGEVYFNFSLKIDNLRRQNETLEKIAQTLFKHWFIDFEFPNDDGKPYKSSGGAMFTSEFGNIPAGWHIACLDEYVNVINGYSYKGAELLESDTALINLKNFDRNGGFRVDGFKSLKTDNYKKQHIVFPDDLIVAHTDLTQNAEVLGNAVLVQPSEKYNKYILSMDLVKLESKKDFLNNFFFYYLLSTREFKGHCVGYSNGTTVLHLSKKAIPEYTFPISDEIDIISNFQNIAYVARKKITNNTQQIQTLTKTRETLLPKLMSGQVRVKE